MGKGRIASRDYSTCTSVMVPVESKQYCDLKVWCITHGVPTVKEKLFEIMNKSIAEVLKNE